MFYCDGWPLTLFSSRGRCEVCDDETPLSPSERAALDELAEHDRPLLQRLLDGARELLERLLAGP